MRVLLRLGAVELPDAVVREHLRERLLDELLAEGDRAVEVVPVPRHGRQIDAQLPELDR